MQSVTSHLCHGAAVITLLTTTIVLYSYHKTTKLIIHCFTKTVDHSDLSHNVCIEFPSCVGYEYLELQDIRGYVLL